MLPRDVGGAIHSLALPGPCRCATALPVVGIRSTVRWSDAWGSRLSYPRMTSASSGNETLLPNPPGRTPPIAGALRRDAGGDADNLDALRAHAGESPLYTDDTRSAAEPPSSLFRAVRCPLCRDGTPATELYSARLPPQVLDPGLFSARRRPDRLHHRMVRCTGCGLVRSDPVLLPEVLANLYRESQFQYQSELPDLRHSYRRQLLRLLQLGARRAALLEVGCGNGFVLEEARRLGFADVRGVEPSHDAVLLSDPSITPQITVDVMRDGLFPPNSFDVVCMFQVFDHLPEPRPVLRVVHEVLRPGGYLLLFNHNVSAVSSRILVEKSPIVDIEHTFLYSPRTIAAVLSAEHFEVVSVRPAVNRCSMEYLAHLVPQGGMPGTWLARTASLPGIKRVRITLPLGNLCAIGRRPYVAPALPVRIQRQE
jgi:SAM-dependent methyltransferase